MDWLQTDQAMQLLSKASLVAFFTIFCGAVIWLAFRKRSEVQRWSRLPLDDDPPNNSVDDH